MVAWVMVDRIAYTHDVGMFGKLQAERYINPSAIKRNRTTHAYDVQCMHYIGWLKMQKFSSFSLMSFMTAL